jgi:hypothetical protein
MTSLAIPKLSGTSFIPKVRGLDLFSTIGELGMFTNKLNLVVPLTFSVLGLTTALIEPALAGASVPAPIIGAGLPALAALAGGYWLIRKVRGRR